MRGNRSVAAVVLLTGVLQVLASAGAQKSPPPISDQEKQRRSLAINLTRAINAAEANFKKNHGVYANWEALVGNGDFTDTGTKWAPESFPTVAHAMYGRGAEIVPGWKLRLNVTKNGQNFDLLLEDVTDPKCGYAVVSDERGRIRQSKGVECEL